MSKILNWEISDDTRTAVAKKLGLEYKAPLEIPCNYVNSSNILELYLDLTETRTDNCSRTEVSFLDWYDKNYECRLDSLYNNLLVTTPYREEGNRLASLICDIMSRGAILYTKEGTRPDDDTSAEHIYKSDHLYVDPIPAELNSDYSIGWIRQVVVGLSYPHPAVLKTSKGWRETKITRNDSIPEGTQFVCFNICSDDDSALPGYGPNKKTAYLYICK